MIPTAVGVSRETLHVMTATELQHVRVVTKQKDRDTVFVAAQTKSEWTRHSVTSDSITTNTTLVYCRNPHVTGLKISDLKIHVQNITKSVSVCSQIDFKVTLNNII